MIASTVDRIFHPGSVFKKTHVDDEIGLNSEVADILGRQQHLIKLCRGLMLYERSGAWANGLATPR
jgi:hypothetical protein